jgi:hypothetical protein
VQHGPPTIKVHAFKGNIAAVNPHAMVSGLMDLDTARNYAGIFKGTVRRVPHQPAPRSRWRKWLWLAALLGAAGIFLSQCTEPAFAFTPLTRAEPVVRLVLQEAANEPFDGQIAVAGVALDRVTAPSWPDTAHGVVYQRDQFTGMGLKLRHYSEAQITRARAAVIVARTGYRPCGHVFWYHNGDVNPVWDDNLDLHCRIGGHLFYGK